MIPDLTAARLKPRPNGSQWTHAEVIDSFKPNGPACWAVMQSIDNILDIMYPDSPGNTVRPVNKKRAQEVWDVFLNLWHLCTSKLEVDDTAGRTKRSQEVAGMGMLLIEHMRGLEITRSVYPHLFAKHFPDAIMAVGDIRKYAGDGIELFHQLLKNRLHRNTNKQPVSRTAKCVSIGCALTKIDKTRVSGEREWEAARKDKDNNNQKKYLEKHRATVPPIPPSPTPAPIILPSPITPTTPSRSIAVPTMTAPNTPATPLHQPISTSHSPLKKKVRRGGRKSHVR
jgi:hypothetical protein